MYFYGYRQHQPHAFVNKLINGQKILTENGVFHISKPIPRSFE